MQIIRTGYCPFKAKKASINIDYIDSSDLNNRSFTKGRFSCDTEECKANNCPIWQKSPSVIYG